MTSFKRWLDAGAIVLVALVACPAMVPKATGSIPGDAEGCRHHDGDGHRHVIDWQR